MSLPCFPGGLNKSLSLPTLVPTKSHRTALGLQKHCFSLPLSATFQSSHGATGVLLCLVPTTSNHPCENLRQHGPHVVSVASSLFHSLKKYAFVLVRL